MNETTKPTPTEVQARERLVRALWELQRMAPGTYGERDAIHKSVPNAIEGMIEAKVQAMIERFETVVRIECDKMIEAVTKVSAELAERRRPHLVEPPDAA